MYGLDLFSGIGGLTKALEGYVQPIAYCENDRYAQAVLLTRMASGEIPLAPIWDDIRTLQPGSLAPLDIIYGGFPCQDISVAGRGAGLAGERSGLFFEIARLVSEVRPRFVFLENVPAINRRGGDIVVGTLADIGYDARWDVLSAADVGANHVRERWWLLAHTRYGSWRNVRSLEAGKDAQGKRGGNHHQVGRSGEQPVDVANSEGKQDVERGSRNVGEATERREGVHAAARNGCEDVAHANHERRQGAGQQPTRPWPCGENVADADGERECGLSEREVAEKPSPRVGGQDVSNTASQGLEGRNKSETAWTSFGKPARRGQYDGWWLAEPNVGRVAHGIPMRVDRLRCLGNSVVPAQAREAFERLIGIK